MKFEILTVLWFWNTWIGSLFGGSTVTLTGVGMAEGVTTVSIVVSGNEICGECVLDFNEDGEVTLEMSESGFSEGGPLDADLTVSNGGVASNAVVFTFKGGLTPIPSVFSHSGQSIHIIMEKVWENGSN